MLWQTILDPHQHTCGRSVMPEAKLFADHGNTKAARARWRS